MNQDLYQLKMAQAHWKAGNQSTATFEYFYRPKNEYPYAVLLGNRMLNEQICNPYFNVSYLRKQGFEPQFIEYINSINFRDLEILALPEGTKVTPNIPMVQVTGELIPCQLLESQLLNTFNYLTGVASTAHQMCAAAKGKPVIEMGLRRAPILSSEDISLAAYIGGCFATSNIYAGQMYGTPCIGTMSHSWVLSHESEEKAFNAYIKCYPEAPTLLVDTYDFYQGIKLALKVFKKHGILDGAIRIDSGHLETIAKFVKKEANGYPVRVIVSDDLTIERIADTPSADAYGVGTNLVVPPAFPGVYKLVEINGKPVSKKSMDKETIGGKKKVGYKCGVYHTDNVESNLLEPIQSEDTQTIRERSTQ